MKLIKKLLDKARERGWIKENEQKNQEIFCKSYYGSRNKKVIKKTN